MKRNTAIMLIGAATAAGAIGALAIKGDGSTELKPSGARSAEWWTQGTEPALWEHGVRSASALVERYVSQVRSGALLDALVEHNRALRDLTSDATYSLMKREAAAPENAAIVKPAIAAVDRHRAYSIELQRFAFFMPDGARATQAQIDAFAINARALASALDRGHYALVAPVAADSGSWLPDVDAIDVISVLNPIIGAQRVGAWGLRQLAPAAGGLVGKVAGDVAGSLVSGLGNAMVGLVASPLGAVAIGGVAIYVVAKRSAK